MSSIPEVLGLFSSAKHLAGQQSLQPVDRFDASKNQTPPPQTKQHFPIEALGIKATADVVEVLAGAYENGTRVIVGGFISILDARSFQIVVRKSSAKKNFPISPTSTIGKSLFGELHLKKDYALSVVYSAGAGVSEINGYLSYYDAL